MQKKSSTTLPIVTLVCALGLGLSSVANADVKWIKNDSLTYGCPSVCQTTTHYLKTPFPFAVPGVFILTQTLTNHFMFAPPIFVAGMLAPM
jgi:hypothetical protein